MAMPQDVRVTEPPAESRAPVPPVAPPHPHRPSPTLPPPDADESFYYPDGPAEPAAAEEARAQPLSAEHARLAESPGASGPWRMWGPYVSGRQWGTVREDYSADGNAWASFPFDHAVRPRLPLGRGRTRRHLRPVRFPQLRGGAVERQGPDPQGTAVRADQRRGQPRRGRQGVLVGGRRHAHPQLDAVAVPLSAGRVPLPAAARRERRAGVATSASTSWATPASSTRTGSSTS